MSKTRIIFGGNAARDVRRRDMERLKRIAGASTQLDKLRDEWEHRRKRIKALQGEVDDYADGDGVPTELVDALINEETDEMILRHEIEELEAELAWSNALPVSSYDVPLMWQM